MEGPVLDILSLPHDLLVLLVSAAPTLSFTCKLFHTVYQENVGAFSVHTLVESKVLSQIERFRPYLRSLSIPFVSAATWTVLSGCELLTALRISKLELGLAKPLPHLTSLQSLTILDAMVLLPVTPMYMQVATSSIVATRVLPLLPALRKFVYGFALPVSEWEMILAQAHFVCPLLEELDLALYPPQGPAETSLILLFGTALPHSVRTLHLRCTSPHYASLAVALEQPHNLTKLCVSITEGPSLPRTMASINAGHQVLFDVAGTILHEFHTPSMSSFQWAFWGIDLTMLDPDEACYIENMNGKYSDSVWEVSGIPLYPRLQVLRLSRMHESATVELMKRICVCAPSLRELSLSEAIKDSLGPYVKSLEKLQQLEVLRIPGLVLDSTCQTPFKFPRVSVLAVSMKEFPKFFTLFPLCDEENVSTADSYFSRSSVFPSLSDLTLYGVSETFLPTFQSICQHFGPLQSLSFVDGAGGGTTHSEYNFLSFESPALFESSSRSLRTLYLDLISSQKQVLADRAVLWDIHLRSLVSYTTLTELTLTDPVLSKDSFETLMRTLPLRRLTITSPYLMQPEETACLQYCTQLEYLCADFSFYSLQALGAVIVLLSQKHTLNTVSLDFDQLVKRQPNTKEIPEKLCAVAPGLTVRLRTLFLSQSFGYDRSVKMDFDKLSKAWSKMEVE